jgi:hypothetical protein
MTETFKKFLRFTTILSLMLFFISLYYLLYNDELRLDADSMLLSMLLVVFTAIASIVQGIILYFLSQKHNTRD